MKYECSSCVTDDLMKEQMYVKRAEFRHAGRNGKMVRSRVIAHLCEKCLESDRHYNQEEYAFQKRVQGSEK